VRQTGPRKTYLLASTTYNEAYRIGRGLSIYPYGLPPFQLLEVLISCSPYACETGTCLQTAFNWLEKADKGEGSRGKKTHECSARWKADQIGLKPNRGMHVCTLHKARWEKLEKD
jgi:hypothetical protein